MVIDCHYHLEERVLSLNTLIKEMDRTGVDKTALMGSITGPVPELPTFLVSFLQFFLERPALRGIGRMLVSNFTDTGEIKVLGKKCLIETDPDNEPVFDAVKQHPERFLGWIFVNPRGKKDQVAEFEKFSGSPGFIGVKAHPFWHHFKPVELAPVAERLERMSKPLLIHAGFGEEGNIEDLLARVPRLKLIIAHAGFPGYADTWKRIRDRKNVYLDLSQTIYTSEKSTLAAADYLGTDRLLFGTDGPYGSQKPYGTYDHGFIKSRIEKLFPDTTVSRRLLGENLAEMSRS